MKVTATMHAFISPNSTVTPQVLQTDKGVHRMQFFTGADKDFWIKEGYTYIGEATITVNVPAERDLVDSKVAALREEIVTTRAKATAKCTQIESQIQQLLCIENSTVSLASVVADDDGIPF